MNPNCPEGCFVPDDSAFDTSIYTELAEVFPDGNLPDMRECVLVMVGQNTHITTHEHDVFSAGEFKDDCAAAGNHTHTITINDPGHGHGVSDPGHDHGRGTQEITGNIGNFTNNLFLGDVIGDGAFAQTDFGSRLYIDEGKIASSKGINFTASRTWTGRSENVTTGVSVNNNTTGITAECSSAGASGANVTRTKQFGVYYYIAF